MEFIKLFNQPLMLIHPIIAITEINGGSGVNPAAFSIRLTIQNQSPSELTLNLGLLLLK